MNTGNNNQTMDLPAAGRLNPPRQRRGLRLLPLTLACALATVGIAQADMKQAAIPTGGLPGHVFNLFGSAYEMNVDCSTGQHIQVALDRIGRNLFLSNAKVEIRVQGVCQEQILVTTDNITLTGLNGAVIDGGGSDAAVNQTGVVTIDGARGFVMQDLTVRNGPRHGVYSRRAAQITLDGLTVDGHVGVGIALDNSSARLNDVGASENGSVGIDIYNDSTVIASGEISTLGNGDSGFDINSSSLLELRGAAVDASDNGGNGLILANGAQLVILNFPEDGPSSVLADANGGAGIFVAEAAINILGSAPGMHEFTLSNSPFGLHMPFNGVLASPAGAGSFVVHDNENGIVLGDGSSAIVIGGLDVQGNDAGLVADGAGTLTIVSIPPNPAAITGNETDVVLSFGTRASIFGADVGDVICDDTVLLRGSAGCL